MRARQHHRHLVEQSTQFARGAGGAHADYAQPLATAPRTVPMHRRSPTPPAPRRLAHAHTFERARAAHAPRKRQTLRATQRLAYPIARDRQQNRSLIKRLRQHAHRGVRHARADARIRKTHQFVAVEPTDRRRTRRKRITVAVDRGARAAHSQPHRLRALALPLAEHTARLRVGHEHAVMQPRAQTAHAARVRIRRQSIGVLVRGVVEHREQRGAVDRRIHRRAQADHAPHLTGQHGPVRAVAFRWAERCAQHGHVAARAAGFVGRPRAQSHGVQRVHERPHLAHRRHDEHRGFARGERAQRHPCEVLTPPALPR